MSSQDILSEAAKDAEPRWPAVVGTLAVGLLYLALPGSMAVGPRWLEPVVVLVLIIASVWTHHRRLFRENHIIGHVLSGILTVFMIWSLALLLVGLPSHRETPVKLLESAVALWITNVLVFALWYWRLDGGGPNGRDRRPGHREGAFLFPQMTGDGEKSDLGIDEGELWSPQFLDYLFVAFNTSTAFSPTDVPVLSRWAKVLTMVQSSISLAVVVLLAARGVNIL